VPEQRQTSFAEPLQQAFIEKDCPDGVMEQLYECHQLITQVLIELAFVGIPRVRWCQILEGFWLLWA